MMGDQLQLEGLVRMRQSSWNDVDDDLAVAGAVGTCRRRSLLAGFAGFGLRRRRRTLPCSGVFAGVDG